MKLTSRIASLALLVAGASVVASATAVPEIDPGSGLNVVALLAGAAIVVRAKLKK